IERFLHPGVQFAEFLFAGFRGYPDRFTLKNFGLRERQGNLKLIPALELDSMFHRNMEAENRGARLVAEQNRTLFGDVAGPARSIDGKCRVPATANVARKLGQSLHASFRTGATRHAVSESLDAPGDAFAVQILTGHDNNSATFPEICRR